MPEMMLGGFTRRNLIGAATFAIGLDGAAAAAGGPEPFFRRTGLPIGLQLYTLAEQATADLDGTLQAVAQIGYKTVEMAGLMGHTPSQVRTAFDRAGLTCASAHIAAQGLRPDPSLAGDIGAAIDIAHVVGARHIVTPIFYFPERFALKPAPGEGYGEMFTRVAAAMTPDDWKFNADFLNAKGEILKKAGLQLAYHNHNLEFLPLNGSYALEMLLQNTDPALVQFEMDAGWVAAAGYDPIALLTTHPGRFRLMHVKDVRRSTAPNFALRQDPTEVGSGIIDWKGLLAAAYRAGVREFFVEQEPPYDKPRLQSVRISFDYLNTLVV